MVNRVLPGDDLDAERDAAADDSSKDFLVPAGEEWLIDFIGVTLVTTATVGNRQVALRIINDVGDLVYAQPAGAVQAASLTRVYSFGPGLPDMTAFRDTIYLTTPIPHGLRLGPGWILRVLDTAAIAAAADDMTVNVMKRVVPAQ